MTKFQLATIGSAFVLFLILYIGCDTTPKEIKDLERSRALAAESTNLDVLLAEARAEMAANELSAMAALEQELSQAPGDSAQAALLRQLSSRWFAAGRPAIAGAYAEKVAELAETEESWSIAGTTFTICVQRSEEEKVRSYCTSQAVKAYENAISLNPGNIANKVNLALLYTENPPADNPMKGILMLRDLNQQTPENVLILNTLARLAMRTGQYDRAIGRLQEALKLEPENAATVCLLAQAFEATGDTSNAQQFAEQCRRLSETHSDVQDN